MGRTIVNQQKQTKNLKFDKKSCQYDDNCNNNCYFSENKDKKLAVVVIAITKNNNSNNNINNNNNNSINNGNNIGVELQVLSAYQFYLPRLWEH